MTIRNLEFLFRPKSIAVIGASDRQGSVGATVIRNVLAGGFSGPVYPVNRRRHREVHPRATCYPTESAAARSSPNASWSRAVSPRSRLSQAPGGAV